MGIATTIPDTTSATLTILQRLNNNMTSFKEAADFMEKNFDSLKLGNDQKLELYGLYKQGQMGDNNNDRPGFTQLKLRAKHDAWVERKGMSTTEAQEKYVELVVSKYMK